LPYLDFALPRPEYVLLDSAKANSFQITWLQTNSATGQKSPNNNVIRLTVCIDLQCGVSSIHKLSMIWWFWNVLETCSTNNGLTIDNAHHRTLSTAFVKRDHTVNVLGAVNRITQATEIMQSSSEVDATPARIPFQMIAPTSLNLVEHVCICLSTANSPSQVSPFDI